MATESALLRFVTGLIDLIQSTEIFKQEQLLEVTYGSQSPHIVWHGVRLGEPDWDDNSHSLAFTLRHPQGEEHLYVAFNAYWQALSFELPPLDSGENWHRLVDTALSAPEDFWPLAIAPMVEGERYRLGARAAIVLMVKTVVPV